MGTGRTGGRGDGGGASVSLDRQRLAEAIFDTAYAADPSVRERLVRSRCGPDSTLYDEVMSLLRYAELPEGKLDGSAPALVGVVEPEQAPGALSPGTRVASYVVESVLGVGGMGVVYLARQHRPQRIVAL